MRWLGYVWAAPVSVPALALALAAASRGGIVRRDGIVEAHGPLLAWALTRLPFVPGGVAAMTLGHVVVATDAHALDRTRAHERVHVRQYERWGPLFVPAYLVASLWAVVRGGHVYFDNPFEREAYRAAP